MPRPSPPASFAALALLAAAAAAQDGPRAAAAPVLPQTVPEASGHRQTSRLADVLRFVDALQALPHGDRIDLRSAGHSSKGNNLLLVRAALVPPPPQPLVVLVTGNIHAGEVEGKEALQLLLREVADGQHEALLRQAVLYFLPVYNPDGNEQVSQDNRPEQNGPEGGVGRRENGQGLDLNRDCVKAEAPETQALLALFAELDPHLYVDLHTTNGSYHGYHLTYAPSLCTNVDAGIAALSRALLDDAARAMDAQHRLQTFDYGNFETRGVNDLGAGQATPGVKGWWSYDHRPRYVVNYFGLRNRIGVLSEAYSYCDFQTRIAATRAFVLCLLEALVARKDEVLRQAAAADAAAAAPGVTFGFDTGYGEPEQLPVLVGAVADVPLGNGRTRHVRQDLQRPETMPVFRRFASRQQIALPAAWALPAPSQAVLDKLRQHGIVAERLAAPATRRAQQFAVTGKRKPKRPYQGHQELVLSGSWGEARDVELPAGTLLVPADQRLSRLAAQLLQPESEDSLARWNFFDDRIGDSYPVLRLLPN